MQPNTPLTPLNQPVQPGPVPQVDPQVSGGQPLSAHDMDDSQVVATAKSLVSHYKQDPFRLSMELDQLKSAYLQSHYHISPNDTEQ